MCTLALVRPTTPVWFGNFDGLPAMTKKRARQRWLVIYILGHVTNFCNGRANSSQSYVFSTWAFFFYKIYSCAFVNHRDRYLIWEKQEHLINSSYKCSGVLKYGILQMFEHYLSPDCDNDSSIELFCWWVKCYFNESHCGRTICKTYVASKGLDVQACWHMLIKAFAVHMYHTWNKEYPKWK